MPEFKERTTYEERMVEAMQDVFEAAAAVASDGLEAVNAAIKTALKKYVGPILEEIQRRVIIILLILFGDDDRTSSVLGDKPGEGPVAEDLTKKAANRAKKQTDDLGDQMAETNRSWSQEWNPDEQSFQDWARDRLFEPSRGETVAITETTTAISLGERDVVDRMEELGVEIDALWITKRDERVCPVCGPLHNQPISQWEDDFPVGPPAHPRCRCFLIYFAR